MTTPQYQSYGYGGSTARTDTSPGARLDVFKKPLDPDLLAKVRKRKVKVLDEDEFVERVEKIVERDFFPELEKLKARNEFLDAKARGDFITMNRLQEKYSGCRPGTGESSFGGRGGPAGRRMTSPATFETPEEPIRENDPRRPESSCSWAGGSGKDSDKVSVLGEEEGDNVENLDKFLANHTSEDNESFFALQEEAEKKHRLKNAWMYKDEKLYLEEKAKQMILPSIEEQAALPVKPDQLEGWTYQNINSVFHNPDTLELSYEEKLDLAKKQKVIKHDNTRLSKNPWKSEKQVDLMRREAEQRKIDLVSGKVGSDGKEIVRPETPMVNGYKLMTMAPSPALGVADSPLMTWGEVESTPFRLEGGETPLFPMAGGAGSGCKGFTMADVPERDKIAKELADKNSRYYRERKAKALEQVKTSIKVGRPGSGRPASGLPNLSPAAKRLVSGKLGIRLGTDDMLRASYTPTPGRSRSSNTPTPSKFNKLTPTPKKTPSRKGVKTPAAAVGTPKSAKSVADPVGDITDNLLNLPAATPKRRSLGNDKLDVSTDNLLNISGGAKRSRAQDFFKS